MLYFLKRIDNDTTFYLIEKNEFVVGRKDCDILIEKDLSVSRKHAKVRIKEGKKYKIVTLEDLGSKYKTYHNGQEIAPNKEIRIGSNDKIQFGGLSSIFILEEKKFVTTATKLSLTQKEELNNQLKLLGGQYVNNWNSECTHLTLETINLTVKVLHAILDNKPIILPNFWKTFTENIKKHLPPPNINDFNNPPIGESLLNKIDFKKCVDRKNLFKNKTFLFYLEKEKNQVDQLIEKAGGKAISWENSPIQLKTILQSPQQFLIMQTSQSTDKAYNEIVKHFSNQNMRTIPTQEIAMAIIHGSSEKDCNPAFNRVKVVFQSTNKLGLTQQLPLVEDTQSERISFKEYETNTIMETLDDQIKDTQPIKKKKPENENPFKQSKLPNSAIPKENNSSCNKENNSSCNKENPFKRKLQTSTITENTSEKVGETSKRTTSVRTDEENPFKRIKFQTSTVTENSSEKDGGTSKRTTSVRTDEENPFKRIKFQTSTVTENTSVHTDKENPFKRKLQNTSEKDCETSKDTANIHAETSKRIANVRSEKENPFKRMNIKTTELTRATQNKSTNENNKDNEEKLRLPLQKNETGVSKDNPFADIFRKRRTEKTTHVSPFTSMMQSSCKAPSSNNSLVISQDKTINDSNVFSSTKINEITVNESVCHNKSTSSKTNSIWISKQTPCKVVYDKEDERQPFMDLFKDKLIVEVMSQLEIRTRCSNNEVNNVSSGAVNFKKFRKVKPLHPQTMVITNDSFVIQGSGNTTGINQARRLLNDSDEEVPNSNKNRRKLRTFDF